MTRIRRLTAIALLLTFAAHASANDVARERIASLIRESGAEVSVAFRTLDGNQELLVEPAKISSVLYQASQR